MMKPHRGAVILAFGILGFAVCQFFGIAAWVMANADLKEMERGYMDPSGRDMTQAGRILGIISTILLAISLPIVIFALVIQIMARP